MLVLAPRQSDDSARIEGAAQAAGLPVLRLAGWRVPPELARSGEVDGLYAEPLFADVVAGPLSLALLEAPLDWLVRCPQHLSRRATVPMSLEQARATLTSPCFVKAWDDKSVPPSVYASGADLPGPDLVDGSTPLLVQGILPFAAEYRFWCLAGAVLTGSRYALDGALAPTALDGEQARSARGFAEDALAEVGASLPTATVLDVGIAGGVWAVVEANAAWGSGLYAADAHAALHAVRAAVARRSEVAPRDAAFVRALPEVRW